MTRTPNMENKLALIWRENVMRLMAHYSFDLKDMVNATGRGFATISGNFGGNIMKAAPSLQTIHIVERAFKLKKGTLKYSGTVNQFGIIEQKKFMVYQESI